MASASETDALDSPLARSHDEMAPPPRPFPRPGFTGSPSSPGSSPRGLKLNFPITTAEFEHKIRAAETLSPRSSRSASPLRAASPLRSGSPAQDPIKPEEPTHFLTALAAQERRVLELREELKKAENDLVRLKYEWTTHESARKRDEVTFQPLQLRAMSSPVKEIPAGGHSTELPGSPAGIQQLATSGRAKSSQRRFEGGKHTRALSLLSPVPTGEEASIDECGTNASNMTNVRRSPLHRGSKSIAMAPRHSKSPHRPEELVSSGKQLVGDLRDGLWTFIEDLRQVTIGDEATSPTRKHAGARVEKKGLLRNDDDTAREEHRNVVSPHKGDPERPMRAPLKLTSGNSRDGPQTSDPFCAVPSDHQNAEAKLLQKSVLSPEESVDKLAWPSLGSFSPGRLSMTASSLMQEWERSLMEPSEPTK